MWLSILGMFEYDNTIFDGLVLPDGIDKDAVINNILLTCAELEVVYPEFETMKTAIDIWSKSNQYTWQKLYNTTTVEYNPLWNVDADITETDTGSSNLTGNDNRTMNSSDIKSVQGFNESKWVNAEKHDFNGSDDLNRSQTVDNENTRTIRRTGNIGVTTSQQLLSQERDFVQFNMINYITESFKKRFCLMVY